MNKIRTLFFIVNLCFVSLGCFAQSESIDTDRPDQSDGVNTISKNKFQIENGITISKETTLNNFMLRFGVTNSTELRLLADFGKENTINGLKPLTLSIKQKLIEQDKLIPSISLVGYASIGKLASDNFQDDDISIIMKFAFENELSDKFSLGYNIGSSDDFDNLSLSSGLAYDPNEKISTFIEYFSTFDEFDQEHNVDVGILIILIPTLQIDFAFGHAIFTEEDRFFTTIGISYLL